jgi:predicted DNA-binding protein (UPF0251 family)
MKPAEAAVICGVSAEAMRQRLSRARTMIADTLEKHDPRVDLDLLPAGGWARKRVTT